MSIKVYIHIELKNYPEKTSKLTIPKSWVASKTVADVIGLFLEGYNTAHASLVPITTESVHLATAAEDGVKLYSDLPIQGNLEDRVDYFVLLGTNLSPGTTNAKKAQNVNALKCKNYGCGKTFIEEENTDTACNFHAQPPFFRDTVKGWQCCRDIKAYDWDEFQAIKGCCVGRHSLEERETIFQSSPTVAAASAASDGPVLKSIADYNTQNPAAVTAASAAVKTIQERKSTRKPDGTAKCLNKGCQLIFKVSENSEHACCYHAGQAVFHDAIKYWNCCPDKKCYDFEAFLQVPGCATGYHDDGEIDLSLLVIEASNSSG